MEENKNGLKKKEREEVKEHCLFTMVMFEVGVL